VTAALLPASGKAWPGWALLTKLVLMFTLTTAGAILETTALYETCLEKAAG
jgi:hypothetical protein